MPNNIVSASLGASWRECPQCKGIEIYHGEVKLSPETHQVTFALTKGKGLGYGYVTCSNCGKVLPIQ
jgi:predicted nucleic-acid-binding Zn-ribbon protein